MTEQPRRRPQKKRAPGRSGKSGKSRSKPYDPQQVEWGVVAEHAYHLDPHDVPEEEDTPDFLLATTLHRILLELPTLQREAIQYRIFENRSFLDASYEMGVDDKGVKRHLLKGLAAVEKELNDPLVLALIGNRLPGKSLMHQAMKELLDELEGGT